MLLLYALSYDARQVLLTRRQLSRWALQRCFRCYCCLGQSMLYPLPRLIPIEFLGWLWEGVSTHGVHIATRLLGGGVTTELCIVDPEQALLSKWKNRTASTGMDYLRSSAGYHLDLSENSLRKFGKGATSSSSSATLFSNKYEQPRLDLFNQHCDAIIAGHQLDKRHIQGYARISNQGTIVSEWWFLIQKAENLNTSRNNLFLLSATTNNCILIGLHKISWTRGGFDTYWTPTFPICTDRHQQNRLDI